MSLVAGGRRGLMGRRRIDLTRGLVGWWTLAELSGTRADSHVNALSLTDNNTVTRNPGVSGVTGDAAQFTAANSEYLNRADEAAFRTDAMTFACWAYADTLTGGMEIATRFNTTGNQRHWRMLLNGPTTRFIVQASSDGTDAGATIFTFEALGQPVAATWYLLVWSHDPVADRVRLSANAGTVDETAYTSGLFASSTADFTLGAQHGGTGTFFNGRVDEAALWNRELTQREIVWLYSAGSGRTYPPREP